MVPLVAFDKKLFTQVGVFVLTDFLLQKKIPRMKAGSLFSYFL